MVENPLRWRSRYWNYHHFQNQVEAAGGVLYTAEVAFGHRPFELTTPDNPYHLQLRSGSEIWHKENALNLLTALVPPGDRYIAFVDADLTFVRPDWVQETLHLLQHYPVLQMFSHLIDVDANYKPLREGSAASSFVYLRQVYGNRQSYHKVGEGYNYGSWGCPGGAWAFRREALDTLGGLMDWQITGSADFYMAKAFYGEIADVLRGHRFNPVYNDFCHAWQEGALKLDENLGYMPGTLMHSWHGPKSQRGYDLRPRLLEFSQFNPLLDIRRDTFGLYQLTGRNRIVRDGLRAIARMRDEDA